MNFPVVEYLSLMAVFGIGAISPGPDFAMVLRQSIAHGREAAVFTSAGIASAILVHGSYTLLGIGLLVSQSLLLFSLLKLVGAAYLIWLGIGALRAPAPQAPDNLDAPSRTTFDGGRPDAKPASTFAGRLAMPPLRAYRIGFLTNLLNPKAVLFFLSLFTTLVSAHTALGTKAFYVGSMSVMLFCWFALVSVFFTTPAIRNGFYRMGQWFNRATGIALIFLALRVALARQE